MKAKTELPSAPSQHRNSSAGSLDIRPLVEEITGLKVVVDNRDASSVPSCRVKRFIELLGSMGRKLDLSLHRELGSGTMGLSS